ncbi:hypothetical protein K1X84_15135 [bacterium]|nr:hypothetical protein [bacterium]
MSVATVTFPYFLTGVVSNLNEVMMKDYFIKSVWSSIEANTDITLSEIRKLSKSPITNDRLKALLCIRQQEFFEPSTFLIARKLIDDVDNDCRWQSIIIVGEFIQVKRNEIWEIILQYGNSVDDDTRTAIATVLLEHFLEIYENDLDSILEELIEHSRSGEMNLLRTLSICWPDISSAGKQKIEQICKTLPKIP